MGVPGFYVWLTRKYKHTRGLTSKELPEKIDYFLIDANCLIHPICFKVRSNNPKIIDINQLEQLMINEVIIYFEKIINTIDPKKGIYLAIDGVAPMAKIKHQRTRRFKSIADKKTIDNIKKKHNRQLDPYWNNSAITPGTIFMEKLHQKILQWYTTLNRDIIYSSYLTPGEGEHKLLQFINTYPHHSYAIYGLDADLIFLSLASKSTTVYLTRDKIEDNTDELIYVSIKIMKGLLVETIKSSSNSNKYKSQIDLNIDKIIIDFIFICYFLGNDFLPHFMSINIHLNGLDNILKAYIDSMHSVYNKYNKIMYLVEDNYKIEYKIFRRFIANLANKEDEIIKENSMKRTLHEEKNNNPYDREMYRLDNILFKIEDPIQLGHGSFSEYRKRYYKHYWNLEDDQIEDFAKKLVKEYLYGLKWVLHYYFIECPSWDWFYPYDHAPFITDIYTYINVININKIIFELGKPLLPFMQLLTVLPKQSSFLLTSPLKDIVSDNKSEIAYMYPTTIVQDFINKRKFWMGIPLLPQINIKLIKDTYNKVKDNISRNDQKRNRTIDIFIHTIK